MTKPKAIFMPHGNIQYSQLHPDRREWVIRESYEKLFDVIADGPYRIAFEASGETVEQIAEKTPDVLEKMVALIKADKLEPVGSPHTHIMLSNIDPEIGMHTLIHGLDTWEKHTGVRPETGWNPECSWNSYLTDIFMEAGYKNLIMDGDSFFLSFPEIRQATGLEFDVKGHSNKNHLFKIEEYIKDKDEFLKYLTNPSKAENGLNLIFRSDMMANLMLWYLMGATEGVREEPVSLQEISKMLQNWKGRIERTGSFIMPYAEDAEYIGTSAYFYVKQFGHARFFESEPESVVRFKALLDEAITLGYDFTLPKDVLAEAEDIPTNEFIERIENGVAWHGGTAKAWANTHYARIMDPVCREIFDGIKAVNKKTGKNLFTMNDALKKALKQVTSAYVSDSRWPPDPTSPGRFNVRESLDDMVAANSSIEEGMAIEGVSELRTLYSPNLMATRIAAIDDDLMAIKYFGEE